MKKQWLRYLLIFLSLLPILILRDFTPDNELKYLSIADEAIRDGNIFAFYNHGVAYADKPPLYIWAIMLGKLLFGKHIMFFISLLSVIPAFITLSVMGKWCKVNLIFVQSSRCPPKNGLRYRPHKPRHGWPKNG